MPGIYGVANSEDAKANLESMAGGMYLYTHFIQDELIYNQKVSASRTHTGQVGELTSPAILDNYFVWIEGEAYNVQEVAAEFGFQAHTLSELLLNAEKNALLDNCLNRLDGYYCAAIYNAESQKLKLISDRYGMRFLYWYHKGGLFAWGSEVKAILAVSGVDKTLDSKSYNCFMELGHLIGGHTWFEHIKLIGPATCIEYDLLTNVVSQHHYWKWSEIQQSNLSFDEAVDESAKRFVEAVKRRFDPKERIGISLSGGLDSRLIFAAIDHLDPDYNGYAYTFGVPDCDDITLARQVIARSGNWKHDEYYFSANNWLTPRVEKIWNTDGMLDMMHMHGSEILNAVNQKIDINLNGFLGDAVLGGSYLQANTSLNARIDKNIAEQFYRSHAEGYCDDFYAINHYDNYLFMVRGRRFINNGLVNTLPWISQRIPFFDNKLVELIYSLPDEYRANNLLYSSMLQRHFPRYFRVIPWQQTGKPACVTRKANIATRATRKAMRIMTRLIGLHSTQSYTNYPSWIRDKENAENLLHLLKSDSAAYKMLTDEDLSARWLQPHLDCKARDYSNQILRAATIELYLRQVFRD